MDFIKDLIRVKTECCLTWRDAWIFARAMRRARQNIARAKVDLDNTAKEQPNDARNGYTRKETDRNSARNG